ncbi:MULTISPECIES: cupin domain-containing protein [unclassified Luteococcus]|uniref:cupin domain-containing protein n=1 Tax=unclassified Luteococcus TaxID=2639923 RepID=UPI00313E1DBB
MSNTELPADDPTIGHVDQGSDAGQQDGISTYVVDARSQSESRGGRPGAKAVLDLDTTKVVAFEFAEGDELKEHAARHPVIIQVLRGRVDFTLPDRTVELVPGSLLHLTPMLRHAVRATEPTTLTVTMLLPHS